MKGLPKTHTQEIFICVRADRFSVHGYDIRLLPYDPTDGANPLGYILVGTTDVTVDIPECNPVQAEIEAIEKARDKILADTQVQVNQLNDRIQRLLCIEHEVAQ